MEKTDVSHFILYELDKCIHSITLPQEKAVPIYIYMCTLESLDADIVE